MDKEQIIYFCLDDSGKLNKNEEFCIYSGFVTSNLHELEDKKRKYKSIRNDIWKKLIYQGVNELKGSNLKNKDRIRLLKFIYSNFVTLGFKINNKKIINKDILTNKNLRLRYKDFALKTLIKEFIIKEINIKKLNPHKPIKIIINLDQESTKTSGYHSLEESIYEELKYGINNFNYSQKNPKPILFSDLKIEKNTLSSKDSIVAQISDLIANDSLKLSRKNFSLNLNFLIIFP